MEEFTAPVTDDEVAVCVGIVTVGRETDDPDDGSGKSRSLVEDVVENGTDFAVVVDTVAPDVVADAMALVELLVEPIVADDTESCMIGVMVTREERSVIMLVIAVCPY